MWLILGQQNKLNARPEFYSRQGWEGFEPVFTADHAGKWKLKWKRFRNNSQHCQHAYDICLYSAIDTVPFSSSKPVIAGWCKTYHYWSSWLSCTSDFKTHYQHGMDMFGNGLNITELTNWNPKVVLEEVWLAKM